ncbi:hypothetical protein QYF36_014274 [Acer negundo]|nr:hypothetical protein QYF36_014274 [Acer negundo]
MYCVRKMLPFSSNANNGEECCYVSTNPNFSGIQNTQNTKTPNINTENPNSNTETQLNITQRSLVVFDSDIEPHFEYHPESDIGDDSNVSLVDSIGDAEDVNDDETVDPNSGEIGGYHSSDEKNGVTRMVRYCIQHEWKPNPNGSISLREGQVFRNAKVVKDVVRRYDIQQGFQLKRVKNDLCRFICECFNDACDWRIHVSTLTDGRTFMIWSISGGHIQCRRGKSNKEAIALWIASVISNTVNSNLTVSARILKNDLLEQYGVECSSQSIYRAKKLVLKTLSADHIVSFAQIRKYGNILVEMNPGNLAKATEEGSEIGFKQVMERIKGVSVEAYQWLINIPIERNLIVYHGKGQYHETCDSYGQRCLVKLSEMSCDCGVWQINGLPYAHAAAVINYQGHSTHEYTNWYYSKEAFKLTYSGSINPIPDPAMWPDVEGAPPDPPKKRNFVGRLKKSRKKSS